MIDREALEKAMWAYAPHTSGQPDRDRLSAAITAYLTALASQEGAHPVDDLVAANKRYYKRWEAQHFGAQEGAQAGEVCGACGQPWTGEKCGQNKNDWPYAICYPTTPPAPDDATTKPEDAWPHAVSWAVSRWNAEVANRPLVNVHRRSLDDTWRQVIRHFGGDPEALCGPSHDELLAANPIVQAGPEKRDLAPDDAVRAAVGAEREACAALLEQMAREHSRAMLGQWHSSDTGIAFRDGAKAIRARKGGGA